MGVGYSSITISKIEDGVSGAPFNWNLLLGTGTPQIVTLSGSTEDYYSYYYVETEYGKAYTNNNTTDFFSIGFDWEYSGSMAVAIVEIEGEPITNIVSASGYYGKDLNKILLSGSKGCYEATFLLTASQAAKATQNVRLHIFNDNSVVFNNPLGLIEGIPIGNDDLLYVPSGGGISLIDDIFAFPPEATGSLTIKNMKFETGSMPSLWCPAVDEIYGTGVVYIQEYYALSADGANPPADSQFSTNVQTPTLISKYLWNYEVVSYSDGNQQKMSKHVAAVYGDTGNGISRIEEYYQISADNENPPTNWVTTPPITKIETPYLWNYEVIVYTNGSQVESEKRIIGTHGATGERGLTWYSGTGITGTSTSAKIFSGSGVVSALVGDHYLNTSSQDVYVCKIAGSPTVAAWAWEQNIKGEKGLEGTNAYFHVKYSDDGGKSFTANSGETPGKWIGTYSDETEADSGSVSKYTWVKIEGDDGVSPTVSTSKSGKTTTITFTDKSGAKTATIIDGEDGKSPTITTSKSGTVTKILADGTEIGQVVDGENGETPVITATKKDGVTTVSSDGVAIATINDGSSVTIKSASKTGDTTTVVIKDATGEKTLTIVDGQDGTNGTPGLNGYIHTAWATSADGRDGFSTTVSAGKTYFGTYTDNTEADSEDYKKYNWSLIKGTGVTALVTEYYLSSSTAELKGGSWQTTVPAYKSGYAYWRRDHITWTDGSNSYTKEVLDNGLIDANSTAQSANSTAGEAKTVAENAQATADEASERVTPGLGMWINHSTLTTVTSGQIYMSGYNNYVPANVDGYIYFNGIKRDVTRGVIKPNNVPPRGAKIYVVLRLTSADGNAGTKYLVWYDSTSKAWKYSIIAPTQVAGNWTWDESTDAIFGEFIIPKNGTDIAEADLFFPAKNVAQIQTTAETPYEYASGAVGWYNSYGQPTNNAVEILNSWAVEDKKTGKVEMDGGMLVAGSVVTSRLATNAIMSSEYTPGTDSPFSAKGSFFDLNTGNIYTPGFSVVGSAGGDAYFKGNVTATSGTIGNWVIKDGNLYYGTDSMTSTKNGIYLGTNGIRNYNYNSDTKVTRYVNIQDGKITANDADISGIIRATSGKIGNLYVDTNKLYSGNHAYWDTDENGIFINDERIAFGPGGVTYFKNDGTGKIGNWTIKTGETGALYYKNSSIGTEGATGDGVYLGTDGIALGNGQFIVNKDGSMYAANATLGGSLLTGSGDGVTHTVNRSGIVIETMGDWDSEVACYLSSFGVASVDPTEDVTTSSAIYSRIIPLRFVDTSQNETYGWYVPGVFSVWNLYVSSNEGGFEEVRSYKAIQSWVNDQGFLKNTSSTTYATQSWVNNKGYLTSSSLSNYATKSGLIYDSGYGVGNTTDEVTNVVNTGKAFGWRYGRIVVVTFTDVNYESGVSEFKVRLNNNSLYPRYPVDVKTTTSSNQRFKITPDGYIVPVLSGATTTKVSLRGTFAWVSRYTS